MRLKPGGDIGAAVCDEPVLACAGMGAPDRLKAELESDGIVDVAAALEIHRDVNHAARRLHKRVHPVLMGSPVLDVLRAHVRRLGQFEFPLEGLPPGGEDGVGIGGFGRRVGVDVVARAIRPTVSGPGNEFGKLRM